MNSILRRVFSGLAVFCVLVTAFITVSTHAASTPPGIRLPTVVTPRHYTVELTIDPDKEGFTGRAEIDVVLRHASNEIWLNGQDLKIASALVNYDGKDRPARVTAVGKDLLHLQLFQAIPAGEARLDFKFTGKMSKSETAGVFRQREGADWYALTQFESIDARRAFPCFDEPHWKTPWQLSLIVRDGDKAVSNTPVLEERPLGHGLRRVVFAETEPLPSYLVAFGVGPFDILEGGVTGRKKTPLRYITPRGRAAEARYPAAATPAIVEGLENYFGIGFPYSKLDTMVVPVTVGFGAMENAGIITYAGGLVMAKPEQESEKFKQDYTSVAAHEIAHQWFGDLVTAAWWDDIWLNESFATWLEGKVVDKLHPEWQWGVTKVQGRRRAMEIDRLASTRIVRQPVNTRDDIDNAFDRITYEKGAAVLNMFDNWMGEDKFRQGVGRYFAAHAFEAATTGDFLAALSFEDPAITPAFQSFIGQPGVPRVEVELQCAAGAAPALKLTQSRSLPLGSRAPASGSWQIPVCVRYPAGAGVERDCTLLQTASVVLPLPKATACPAWVQANAGGSGYYRPLYDGDLQKRLTESGLAAQSTAEIVAMQYDVLAGAQSGDVPIADALSLAQRSAGDVNRNIVEASLTVVGRSSGDLLEDTGWAQQAKLLQSWYGARAHALGFEPSPGESEDNRLLRAHLVPYFADAGEDAALLADARRLAERRLDNPASVDASVAAAVLSTAAQRGDAALFERMRNAARTTQDRRERNMLVSALGAYRDPALNKAALALTLSPDFEARDSIIILREALDDRHTRRAALDFLEKNYDALVKRLPPQVPARFPSWADGFCDTASRNEIAEFFGKRMEKQEGGKRNLAQALERIDLCVAFRANQQAGANAFLAGY